MKYFCALLLAILTLTHFAHADTIVVYQGYQVGEDNNNLYRFTGRSNNIVVFDVTTLQSVAIQYGGTIPAQYYYSVGAASPFVYAPIKTGANTSQTYFANAASTTGSNYSLNYSFYVGDNLTQTLGGAATGQFPNILTYTSYIRNGNGTTGADIAGQEAGAYLINLELTRSSNASNDNLATATAVVTAALGKAGYVSE